MEERLDITGLLQQVGNGDRESYDEVFSLVYTRLHNIAHAYCKQEKSPTMNTSALVHEAYIKMGSLVGNEEMEWKDRAQFYFIFGRTMRRLLVDYARTRKAQKRGGKDAIRMNLSQVSNLISDADAERWIELDEALEQLCLDDKEACQVVELRYFVGLTNDEVAQTMNLSVATVRRRWRYAKARLYTLMTPPPPEE